jgi:hypothetical protein
MHTSAECFNASNWNARKALALIQEAENQDGS